MDSNAHAGPSMLAHDVIPQNQNGKRLLAFLARNPCLSVVNAMDICEGTVTRIRKTVKGVERSTIDFYIVNNTFKPFITKMTIDTDKEYGLTNFAQIKINKRPIQSDHCPLMLKANITYSKIKPERIEHFNMRNTECQQKFKTITDETQIFEDCFNDSLPPLKQIETWHKKLNKTIHESFKKIRVNNKNNKKLQSKSIKLQEERSNLKKLVMKEERENSDKSESMKNRIEQIEYELGEENAKENMEKIKSLETLGGESDCINTNGM